MFKIVFGIVLGLAVYQTISCLLLNYLKSKITDKIVKLSSRLPRNSNVHYELNNMIDNLNKVKNFDSLSTFWYIHYKEFRNYKNSLHYYHEEEG